ncbi:MAG: Do family serine endopeptidase [Gammaproteobacteria bacterium]|nr:Do family serine endopeptidase [Gammaproteobacteria bacterium]
MRSNRKFLVPAILSFLITLPAGATIFPTSDENGTPTLAPLIEQASPAVVNIATTGTVETRGRRSSPFENDPFFRRFFNAPSQPRRFQSAGSGVIVDSANGYIITNNHVVEHADEITVTMFDERVLQATIVGRDPASDLAVLKVESDGLQDIPLANSDDARVGDFVVAIGNPFGLQHTVTSGIISALGRHGINPDGYEDFIQTDASINPGNSGGALINLNGELVGINSAIISGGGGNIGIGFAIPSNMVNAVMNQIIEFGEVRRGLLGVQIYSLTPALAKELEKENALGALVSEVSEGSAAAMAGIEPGDVIIEVDGEIIKDSAELRNTIGMKPVGEEVRIGVWRDGKTRSVLAYLGEQVKNTPLAGADVHDGLEGASLIGTSSADEHAGVRVLSVEPNSPAAQRGLRSNDIITEVNRRDVENLQQFRDRAEGAEALLLTIRRGKNRLLIPVQ